MIRYAATSTARGIGRPVHCARSLSAYHRNKSTPAQQRAWEEEEEAQDASSPTRRPASKYPLNKGRLDSREKSAWRKGGTSTINSMREGNAAFKGNPKHPPPPPPRFQSWKGRLEQHHQEQRNSLMRNQQPQDKKLTDFFNRRRTEQSTWRQGGFNSFPQKTRSDDQRRRGVGSSSQHMNRYPSWGRPSQRGSNYRNASALQQQQPRQQSKPTQRSDHRGFQPRQQSKPTQGSDHRGLQPRQQSKPTQRSDLRGLQPRQQSKPTQGSDLRGNAPPFRLGSADAKNSTSSSSLHQPLTQTSPTTSMTDISHLRAALLRTPKDLWKPPRQAPSKEKQAWRLGSAKDFRKQQQERKKQAHDQKKRRWRVFSSTKNFFNTFQETTKQLLQQQEKKRGIALPIDGGSVDLLAAKLRVGKNAVVNILEAMGERQVDGDFEMDIDTMELVTLELGFEPVRDARRAHHVSDKNLLLQRRAGSEAAVEEEEAAAALTKYESFPPRPPVVACMGHVDHGKTTLMDALRRKSLQSSTSSTAVAKKSKKGGKKKKKSASANQNGDVAGTEAGGITQVISAFQIALEGQERGAVTFLDTPGHAAFRAMRESGSHAADVIVLVVAADDGVSPQTVEILDFYKSIVKEAGGGAISLVVAMNKIDKPGVDVDESRMRIENQLLEHGIITEDMAATSSSDQSEYGPPVQLIPVSGLTGDGLDDLVEGLVLQSEVMDLRADQDAKAEGIVMDARVEKGLGVVADCIVRWGSLERGHAVVSGVHSGKVKVLKDVNGKTLETGMPSQPVRLIGFESLPKAGDPIICVSSEEKAKRLVEKRKERSGSDETAAFRTDSTDDAQFQVTGTASKTIHMTEMAENKYDIDDDEGDTTIRIPVLIKADADGTLAAVRDSLLEVGNMSSTYDIVVDPVGMGIGPILTSDVALAKQSGASIFSFGLRKLNDKTTLKMAEGEGVPIRCHDVIYSLLDDAKETFAQHLPLAPVEVVHGSAMVQAVFDINNKNNGERIAGLKVTDGTLYKDKATVEKSRIDCHYRVLRNGERISPAGETLQAASLRRVKEDVEDVRRGDECGLGLDGFSDVQEGDIIECYSMEMKRVFV